MAEEAFRALGEKYEWDPEVIEWMTSDMGLRAIKLQDFEYAMSKEEDAKDLVSKMKWTIKSCRQAGSNKHGTTSRRRENRQMP